MSFTFIGQGPYRYSQYMQKDIDLNTTGYNFISPTRIFLSYCVKS